MFSTDDDLLCPVRSYATTVSRLWDTVSQANENTRVCSYVDQGAIGEIDSMYARSRLRSIIELIGVTKLGITRENVGLHSIRSGGVMAMFLSGVATIIIQRVGCWESDIFIEYVREQGQTFTVGVSKKMLMHQEYYHLNKAEENNYQNKIVPTFEGGGEPLGIPHSAYVSKRVLGIDSVCSL